MTQQKTLFRRSESLPGHTEPTMRWQVLLSPAETSARALSLPPSIKSYPITFALRTEANNQVPSLRDCLEK